ncbi:MAG: hypothetical protein H5T86_07360, partial [Armatimonadetes bacterium]|nr:hypothetical protein [Armatimonadota bacterium]
MTPETRPYTHSAGLGRASRILAYRTRLAALAALAIGLIFVQIGLFQHAAIVPWQQRAADAVLVALLLIAVYRLNQHMSARGARPVATAPEEALLWVLFGSAAVAILTRTGGLRAVADALSIAALSIFTEVVVAYEALKIALALPRAVLVARVARLTVSPSATVALSFAVVIAAGTILLNLPAATAGGRLTRPVDALFTATSATCVTGLIVHDTPTHWSFFGQLVILALIQIGGLGTMTLGTTMRTLLRQRLSVIERVAMRDTVAPVARADIAHLAARIVQFTAVCELAGALVLALWWWSGGMPFLLAMWKGLFHAVSAFCNAGFSLFSNSLEDFAGDPVVNVVICSLIVVGGLGFPAVTDIWRYAKARLARRRAHLSLHTRLVLLTTAALIIGAATFFAAVEWNGAFARRPAHE